MSTAPLAPAVRSAVSHLSYRDLDERASALAGQLRDRGIGQEDLIALCLPYGELAVLAMLGVRRAGAAWAGFDHLRPARRLAAMIEAAGAKLVLTSTGVERSGAFAALPADSPERVCLDLPWPGTGDTRAARAPGGGLVCVSYASGPAGRPEGAMYDDRSIAACLAALSGALGLTAGDRVLVPSAPGHALSACGVLAALAAGASIVVPDDDDQEDPAALLSLLTGQAVTVWLGAAPASLDALVSFAADCGGLAAASLRVIGVAGGPMPASLPIRLSALLPRLKMIGLGPVAAGALYGAAGLPLPGSRCYVLDECLRPVPAGVPGQLFIGGAAAGRGYLGCPRLTAARQVADPFSAEPGARMVAAGERARFRPDGTMEYLGRGTLIEAAEIERAIAEHPAVLDVIVTRTAVPGDGPRLTAYLTARIDPPPRRAELHEFTADRLPPEAIPAFVVLEELPRRADGSLDQRLLPDQVQRQAAGEPARAAPDGALERTVAALIADVLQIEQVGALDDFFELGGHSLLATQAVSRIRELFRSDLTIPAFLAASTVRGIASDLRELALQRGLDADAIAEVIEQATELPDPR